jgi:diguanylate cyclase (GGDEF)-like protein
MPVKTRNNQTPGARKYNILLRIIKAANDRLDPENVIATIMDNIQKLIPCEAWSILLFNKEEELVFQGARGAGGEHLRYQKLKPGEGIAGWVAKYGKPAIVNDVGRDSRFDSKFDHVTNFKTRSVLCAPLISRDRVIGVAELINKKTKNCRFTNRDLDMLLALLGPVAVSLHNAFLFQETEKLTITDDLTKLYNNRYINRRLTRLIEEHRRDRLPFSLIFLDLDGFKTVNDRYGHLVGAKTLIEIGKVILNTGRKQDVIARYGGDEFIVIMPRAGAADAVEMAEKIRLAIQNHDFNAALQREIHLSASFGISVFPDHANNITELIQKADKAMYAVKYSGKNAVQLANGKEI